MGLRKRFGWEVRALLMFFGVRRASEVINFTRKMAWEVELLYGRRGRVIRGAVPRAALDYRPKQDIKAKLGLSGKDMILNVNRLENRKRVDLVIRAFSILARESQVLHLVIGGAGPEEGALMALARDLGLTDRISFVGFIAEQDLFDYYASCSVFVHPNWADHALAPYEALAMQRKVVWTNEMEMEDDVLKANGHIFPADPTPTDFAAAIRRALTAGELPPDDMTDYAWDRYCEQILQLLQEVAGRKASRHEA